MRVSFVLYEYFPFGGLQHDCLATALAMRSRGHDVEIVTRKWTGQRPDGVEIVTLGKKGWTNIGRNFYFFKSLEQYYRLNPTDAVVAFNRIPKCDFYFSADPCYLDSLDRRNFLYYLTPRHWHFKQLERYLFKEGSASHVYCLTEREIEAYLKYYDVSQDRLHLLPPGVRRNNQVVSERIAIRQALRAELGVPEERLVALFVGSNFKHKGLLRNLEALREVSRKSDVELWVLGTGERKKYEEYAHREGLSVRFLGGRFDVERYYDSADILLHPSKGESAGKILLEALTHGLPVVATDTCGYENHLIQSGGGLVISTPFSQAVYNNTLDALLGDPGRLRQMSERGLAYAQTEDLYSCASTFSEKIEQVLVAR